MGGIRAPTLVLLAGLGLGIPGWSATSTERDQHAQAVAVLIAAGLRLPAERQFADFQAARYPTDDASLDVVLRFLHHDRFLATMPAAEQQARTAELKRLREQVSRLLQSMPANVRAVLVRGTGTSVQLVNTIARVLHPDDAPPLVPLAAEKSAHLREQVSRLLTVVEAEFQQALAVAMAYETVDQSAWELPEGSPQQHAALQAAVERRLATLHPLRTGMMVLREVVVRGDDFGVDARSVREQLRALFAAKPPMSTSANLVELLADWDFAWGELSPVVGEWCGSLLGDALVLGSSAIRPEEVDRIQRRVLALDPRQQRVAHVQVEMLGVQVRTLTDALRWRLYRGDRVGFTEAWQMWQEFATRTRDETRLLPGRHPVLTADLVRLHLVAARLAAALGDRAGAAAVLQPVMAARAPFDEFARHWQEQLVGDQSVPTTTAALEPSTALMRARAHLDEAKATGDAQAARHHHLQAATVLRRGILGLYTTRGDARSADQLAQLYHLYVITLSRLEMRHHAVIAALSGTDQALLLIERLERQQQPNPWKRLTTQGRSAWDDQRITPLRLATDGMIIASQLKARDPRMNGLYLAAIDRLGRLDPTGKGGNLMRQQIIAMIEEEDYEGALREADHLLRTTLDQDAWVSSVRNRVLPALAQRLRRSGENAKADDLLARLARDNAAMLAKAQAELANPDLAPARRQELERALSQIQLADIEILATRQEHGAIIERLGVMLATDAGTDAVHRARLQERLAQVLGQWVDAQQPSATTSMSDLRVIVARLEQVRTILQPADAMTIPINAAKRLALAYHRVRSVLPAASAARDDDTQQMIRLLDRGFSESFAPTVDAQTPVGNLMALGQAWWDLGERSRAIVPYERGLARMLDDPAVAAFLQDRRAWLATRTDVLSARAEFRARWQQVVSSCIGDGDRTPADLRAASTTVSALKTDIDAAKSILGGELHLRLLTAVGEVDAVLRKLLGVALARQRLADCYRATGKSEAAIPHLQQLCAQEPNDPAHRLALVLAIQSSRQPSSRADLELARRLAAQIRDERQGTTDKVGYWEASLLVLELSLLLGEHRLVDDTLSFMGRNRSDLSRDLVAPTVTGDDRRVRRPSGVEAVMLAKRFLDLYGKQGITARPPFRIEQVAGGVDLFVDHAAPAPVARTITTTDEQQVLVYVVEGYLQPIP